MLELAVLPWELLLLLAKPRESLELLRAVELILDALLVRLTVPAEELLFVAEGGLLAAVGVRLFRSIGFLLVGLTLLRFGSTPAVRFGVEERLPAPTELLLFREEDLLVAPGLPPLLVAMLGRAVAPALDDRLRVEVEVGVVARPLAVAPATALVPVLDVVPLGVVEREEGIRLRFALVDLCVPETEELTDTEFLLGATLDALEGEDRDARVELVERGRLDFFASNDDDDVFDAENLFVLPVRELNVFFTVGRSSLGANLSAANDFRVTVLGRCWLGFTRFLPEEFIPIEVEEFTFEKDPLFTLLFRSTPGVSRFDPGEELLPIFADDPLILPDALGVELSLVPDALPLELERVKVGPVAEGLGDWRPLLLLGCFENAEVSVDRESFADDPNSALVGFAAISVVSVSFLFCLALSLLESEEREFSSPVL